VDETDSRKESGVDCEARDQSGNRLKIQVTRADSDKAFYRRQATEGRADKLYANVDILIGTWREPIRDEATLAGRGDIVLALDAAEASSTLPDVIAVFREQYGPWAVEQSFQEIWIVGGALGMDVSAGRGRRQA
jgi:hypothetical protein